MTMQRVKNRRRQNLSCVMTAFMLSTILATLVLVSISLVRLNPPSSWDDGDRPTSSQLQQHHHHQLQPMQSSLGCLVHAALHINATEKAGADPTQTVLEQQVAINCGKLKRQWLHNPPLSAYARALQRHQSDCSLPLAHHYLDNTFGLGSHFILWGQALCNAQQDGYRMDAQLEDSQSTTWLWLDQEHCVDNVSNNGNKNKSESLQSPMECYLPTTNNLCQSQPQNAINSEVINLTDPRKEMEWCALTKDPTTKAIVRAASTEYLFSQVSPLVIQEAQRQIGIIFSQTGRQEVPDDMVTVHIRWGDKFWEMDLASIEEYMQGIARVMSNDNNYDSLRSSNTNATLPLPMTADIFLATEDPKAYQAFLDAKPHGWNVYADITLHEINAFRPPKGNRASWAARNTRGRAGLVALASLLVAMEAKYYVLTTKSNWSTMMDHLRTNVIDPRCGNCTCMVDLRPFVW